MKTILVPYHEEEAARAALKVAVLLAANSKGSRLLISGGARLRRFADRARREFAETADANRLPLRELETPATVPSFLAVARMDIGRRAARVNRLPLRTISS